MASAPGLGRKWPEVWVKLVCGQTSPGSIRVSGSVFGLGNRELTTKSA